MKKKLSSIVLIVTLLILLAALRGLSRYPDWVMTYYTKGIYLKIKYILGLIADKMSFAYGEVLVGSLIILGIGLIVYRMKSFLKQIRLSDFSSMCQMVLEDGYRLVSLVLCMLIIFQGLWGLNYHQATLLDQLGLSVQTVKPNKLESLLREEIALMEKLRFELKTTADNVVTTDQSIEALMVQSMMDYQRASELYSFIEPPSSQPKPIMSSLFFSYSGISGIYNPFTGEANVNQLNSVYMIPAVALHELSHQQGIAREDEANFIAYLVAISSDEVFTEYSGRLLIVIHGLNNLKTLDPERHRALYEDLPLGIRNDLRAHRLLWHGYDSPLDELQETMNDEYLKANGLESGVGSYSEVVNLYVAWATKK